MVLKLTLVPVREDRERYSSLVSYELANPAELSRRVQSAIGANPAATGDFVIAVRRTREWLVDPKGKSRFQVVRVTELGRIPGRLGREWPRKIDQAAPEPEALRRDRVRAMRKAIHVDPAKGAQEPVWWDAASPNGNAKLVEEQASAQ